MAIVSVPTFHCDKESSDTVTVSNDPRHVEVTVRESGARSSVFLRPRQARDMAQALTRAADAIQPASSPGQRVKVGDTLKVNRNSVAGTGCRIGDRLTVTYVDAFGEIRTNGRGLGAAWYFHTSDITAGFLTVIPRGEAEDVTTESPREAQFRKAKELAPEGASTTDLLRLVKFLTSGE